jgi:hypothetical protein
LSSSDPQLCVALAEGFARLYEEALSFEVLLAELKIK